MIRKFFDRVNVVVGLFALTILASGCESNIPGPPSSPTQEKSTPASVTAASLPIWNPDPALLKELEPYQDIEGYQIRVPKRYELAGTQSMPSGGEKVFMWAVPLAEDDATSQGRPSLSAVIITPPPGSPDSSATATKMLGDIVPSFKKSAGISNWTPTPEESGQIGGIPYVRIGWQGTVRETKACGYIYAGKDADTFIIMFIGDADSAGKESLKVLSAAVMTCRKK